MLEESAEQKATPDFQACKRMSPGPNNHTPKGVTMFDSNYIVTDRQPTTQPHPASGGRWGYNRRDNAINYRCGNFRW